MERKAINDFEFHRPTTIQEALELRNKYQENGTFMVGGTEIIPCMKALVMTPDHIISLKYIDDMKYIKFVEGEGIHIGPSTTLSTVEHNDVVKKKYPSLAKAIHSMSNTAMRNVSTIAGNICFAVPSADTAPPLLTLEAELTIKSVEGERKVSILDFFTGVRKTVLKPNEMITDLFIPEPDEHAYVNYYKNPTRKAQDLAVAGAATYIVVDEEGICKDVRIAMGAVARTPLRAPDSEKMLLGNKLTEEIIEAAAEHAASVECSPISDIRASADYRRELIRLSIRDGLVMALK